MRTSIGRSGGCLWLAVFMTGLLGAQPSPGAETRIATYKQSFTRNEFQGGQWFYFWNAPIPPGAGVDTSDPSGRITDPVCYQPLKQSGGAWTGPGDIRLSRKGGHPGPGAGETGTTYGRYAISAFKVDRDGSYSIRHSYLRKPEETGDYIDIIVQAGAWRPVLRRICQPGETVRFDTEVGHLPAGTLIYVAVGPGMNSTADDFEMNYSIWRNDTPTLQEQIDRAKAGGASPVRLVADSHESAPSGNPHSASVSSCIRLVPGRYYATGTLTIDNWQDFNIDATGVTLIESPKVTAVSVDSCLRGRLKGLTIDQDPLPLTQGRIVAIDSDRLQVDLDIDDFYPIPAAGRPAGDRNMIFDPVTLDQIQPAAGFNIASIERLGGDSCRLILKHPLSTAVQEGDLLSIQSSAGPAAFLVKDSGNMVFDSITLHSSGGFAFYENACSSNTYQSLKLTPGPQHLLAARPRLRTTAADGFHSRNARVGPKVINSLFERTGDDGMAIDGPWGVVVEDSSGNQACVAVRSGGLFQTGTVLRFFRFADFSQARGTVASYQLSDDKVAEARRVVHTHFPAFANWTSYQHVYLLTLNLDKQEQPGLKPGDLVSFPGMNGDGFEFRNNTIRGGRSRGIIVKANGVIEDNHIENCQKPGILVYVAYGHSSMEAQFVEHLLISSNTIDGCVFMQPTRSAIRYCGGIVIAADKDNWGANGHRNIRVGNNVIRNVYRGVNMTIANASNVVLENNRFVNTHQHAGGGGGNFGVDNSAVIWIDNANGVSITNCTVEGLGPYGNPNGLISTTATARNVTGNLLLEQP